MCIDTGDAVLGAGLRGGRGAGVARGKMTWQSTHTRLPSTTTLAVYCLLCSTTFALQAFPRFCSLYTMSAEASSSSSPAPAPAQPDAMDPAKADAIRLYRAVSVVAMPPRIVCSPTDSASPRLLPSRRKSTTTRTLATRCGIVRVGVSSPTCLGCPC